jgi:hypothetical protein
MTEAEFKKIMGASKAEFYGQPKWKRNNKKKETGCVPCGEPVAQAPRRVHRRAPSLSLRDAVASRSPARLLAIYHCSASVPPFAGSSERPDRGRVGSGYLDALDAACIVRGLFFDWVGIELSP